MVSKCHSWSHFGRPWVVPTLQKCNKHYGFSLFYKNHVFLYGASFLPLWLHVAKLAILLFKKRLRLPTNCLGPRRAEGDHLLRRGLLGAGPAPPRLLQPARGLPGSRAHLRRAPDPQARSCKFCSSTKRDIMRANEKRQKLKCCSYAYGT